MLKYKGRNQCALIGRQRSERRKRPRKMIYKKNRSENSLTLTPITRKPIRELNGQNRHYPALPSTSRHYRALPGSSAALPGTTRHHTTLHILRLALRGEALVGSTGHYPGTSRHYTGEKDFNKFSSGF